MLANHCLFQYNLTVHDETMSYPHDPFNHYSSL